MQPQIVRLVLSSRNLQYNLGSPNQIQVKNFNFPASGSPIHVLTPLPSNATTISTVVKPTVSSPTVSIPVNRSEVIETFQANNGSEIENNTKEPIFTQKKMENSPKTTSSLSSTKTKKHRKVKDEENDRKVLKRSKNWTEAETVSFISVWSDYYTRLMSGGSRNAPLYQCMAKELTEMLEGRILTGPDVKAKIGNLVNEYRKRRKEQGKTGASPSPWPYYDLLDKILGERPYNDDSLLSDSMHTEDDPVYIPMSSTPKDEANSTQVSEQVQECLTSTSHRKETSISTVASSDQIPSPSKGSRRVNETTPLRENSAISKKNPKRKKRISELKVDLIQDILGKIENANDAASRSEVKLLELLEKQTRLQEESMNTEREFLNVFKNIMTNMNSNK